MEDKDIQEAKDAVDVLVMAANQPETAAAGIGGGIVNMFLRQAVEMLVAKLQDENLRARIRIEIGNQLDRLLDYLVSLLGDDAEVVKLLRSMK